jgi:hypothetical protein
VSFDPAARFKIRALEIQDNPAEKIVALRTEPVSLAELIEEGSVRLGGEDAIDAASGVTAAFGGTAAGYLHFTEPLDGMVLFEDDAVRIEVVTGYVTFDAGAIVSGDFKERRLVSFDFDGSANLFYKMDLQVRAKKSLERSGSRRILPPFRKVLGTVIGGFPVWVELVVELKAGYEAEAEVAGTVSTGIEFRKVTGIQVRLRDGNWTHSIVSPDPRFEPNGPEWQIEGTARARVFLEPKATFYLESLAGPSVNLMPYLELAGQFQSNPLAYDWGLYAGLTSPTGAGGTRLGRGLGRTPVVDSFRSPPHFAVRRVPAGNSASRAAHDPVASGERDGGTRRERQFQRERDRFAVAVLPMVLQGRAYSRREFSNARVEQRHCRPCGNVFCSGQQPAANRDQPDGDLDRAGHNHRAFRYGANSSRAVRDGRFVQ